MVFLSFAQSAFPLPVGVVGISPPLDLTNSFPSTRIDRGLDWLMFGWGERRFPKPSKAWPTTENRSPLYTNIPLHPLVSASKQR